MRSVEQVAHDYNLSYAQAEALRMWLENKSRAHRMYPDWPRYEQVVQDTRVWYHVGHVSDALRLDGAPWWLGAWHALLASLAK